MEEIVRKTKAMKKLQDMVNSLEQISDYSKK